MSFDPTLRRPPNPAPVAPPAPPAAVEFRYTQTESFVALLHELGAALLVTTYQANKLLVVRAAGGGLSTLVRTFDRPMGVAADGHRLALGTRDQVWFGQSTRTGPAARGRNCRNSGGRLSSCNRPGIPPLVS